MIREFREFRKFTTHTAAVFSCDPTEDWNGYHYVTRDWSAFDKPSLETRAANLERQGLDASLERSILASWPE